jgi:hypothetical protein
MFFLSNLSKSGYIQIKTDRDAIAQKIEQNQVLLDEIDAVLPFLESLYEPNITIKFNNLTNLFIASTTIKFNNQTIKIQEKLGGKMDFQDIHDSKLIELANRKINNRIKNQFPLHFQD